LLGHVRIVQEVLQKLVHSSGVSISTDTLFIHWNVHPKVILCMSILF